MFGTSCPTAQVAFECRSARNRQQTGRQTRVNCRPVAGFAYPLYAGDPECPHQGTSMSAAGGSLPERIALKQQHPIGVTG